MRKLLAALVSVFALMPLAHADVYGFVDDKGVAHFAAEPVDARYQLFFRGGQGFDTSLGLPVQPSGVAQAAPPRLLAYIETAPGYRQVRTHLREASIHHGIDYELLQALIATESGFDIDAISPKGAIGLMQVMPATAQRYGLAGDRKRSLDQMLADPRTNIRTGSRYLSDLIRLFPGELELALAAYNAGEGAVQRAGNRIPNYPETRNYVKTVMQLYAFLKPATPVVAGRTPNRVRMELGGVRHETAPTGGAVGRGNMPAGLPQAEAPNQVSSARD